MTNSVYLTFRRDVGEIPARAVFHALRAAGIDVFMDVDGEITPEAEATAKAQIAARAYTVLIIVPGTLERLNEKGDWLREQLAFIQSQKRPLIAMHPAAIKFREVSAAFNAYLGGAKALQYGYDAFDTDVVKLRTQHLRNAQSGTPQNPHPEVLTAWEARLAALPPVDAAQLKAQVHFEAAFARERKDWAGRIADYDEAVRLYPNFSAAFARRGANKDILDDTNGAMSDLNEAIRLNPYNDVALVNRGILRAKLGDLHSAFADYEAALKINPKMTAAFYNRALARSQRGDYDGAIEDLNETIKLDPRPMYYFQRGVQYGSKADSASDAEALADYTEAIRLNPKMAEAYYNRGLIRAKTDMERAVNDWTAAINADPSFAEPYYNRGLVMAEIGEVDLCIADFSKYLELVPDAPQLREVRETLDRLRAMRSGQTPPDPDEESPQ